MLPIPRLFAFRISVLIIFSFNTFHALATHNRAGEISVEQVGDCTQSLTVRATITTYTKASSVQADRDSLQLCWGDGDCIWVYRANGPAGPGGFLQGELLENDTKRNVYIGVHTYEARSTYVISMTDPNRNGGILNVNFPNSEQIMFHIQTTYTFPNPQFQGCNDTPVLLQPPIDIGCVGQRFIHNVNAYDRDGDSLSYEFITPLQSVGMEVPNYNFPDEIRPGPMNTLTIDEVTGDIVWDAPQQAGEYNLAMIIIEYRQGIPIDTIIRDMQILIEECDNLPPKVETPVEEICVVAGEVLQFPVTATAPLEEPNQRVRLTALGGPFEVDISPATFLPNDSTFNDQPFTRVFRWETQCEHINEQFYSVVFKATDNFFSRDSTGLAELKTVRIKVVGPPPEDVRAASVDGGINVSWEAPYFCEEAENDYFRGFTVWRREGSNIFPFDSCETGLAGRGYEKLTPFNILPDLVNGRYEFRDVNVEQGRTYCYRILAEFARATPGGQFIYNLVESLPSDESCVQLQRDLPLLLEVDVEATDTQNGAIKICWTKPRAEDLDTVQNPGPYTYEILRADGLNPGNEAFQAIGVQFESPTLGAMVDTCYLDEGLNTVEQGYSYKINFYTGNSDTEPLGVAAGASSVFISATPSDQRNILSWDFNTPWENFEFTLLRQNDQGGFDSLTTVFETQFTDEDLVNGQTYCYFVEATGAYGIEGVRAPLINKSQVICSTPRDDVPPCTPALLLVENICGEIRECASEEELINTLRWSDIRDTCETAGDLVGYQVFYAPMPDLPLELIDQVDDPGQLFYEHQPPNGLAGCYAITAVDTAGNVSPLSNTICVDNCPQYELPNAFTPNGDQQNEVFTPRVNCFIETIEFQVFNRWGELVFETSDPQINWDGTNFQGEQLAEGTYYYVCTIFENRVQGVVEGEETLRGFIQLIRGTGG